MPDYDAIVIGSGISGGWAAKELCEKGLKTLLLERGPMIEHPKDYKTANDAIWDDPHRERLTKQDKEIYPVQSTIYAFGHASRQYFVKDAEHPYIQEKPFGWIRGYQMGGRSLLWGRQSYRFSNLDFEANLKDGYGVDWPIRYHDIAPWYSYVERFVGISGAAEQLPQLPDGEFLPPMPMNCLEKEVKARLEKAYNNHRKLIMGRVANLTVPHKGRGPCHYRNRCHLGCPFGGYFSTNSATLPAAIATGKLTIRPNSIVAELIYDSKRNRIKGVRVIDADTKQHQEFYAKIVFLNASTIATAAILLQSKSAEFPNGIGNNYNQVGHNLLNHHVGVGATGQWEGFTDKYYSGRRANDKDANEPKSMNTHLHILEAYTSLFQIWPDERLRTQLEKLLQVFNEYILDARTGHLQLFFGMNWSVRSQLISFGHDIEAAWLLLEAAEALGNSTWIGEMRENAVRMAAAASRGLDADGGLWYEYNLGTHHLIAEKHWWPQAEALVGFYNAWQISGDETWLKKLNATWSFIQQKLKDHKQGEWYWGIDQHDAVLSNEDKAGFWKCPYHNGRACLELINRLEQQA